MNPTIAQAILLAVAVLAILFLIHRFTPTSTVAKAEDVAIADAKKVEPALQALGTKIEAAAEADAMAALAKVTTWITDTSAESAMKAEAAAKVAAADASIARKGALRQHLAATLSAPVAPVA